MGDVVEWEAVPQFSLDATSIDNLLQTGGAAVLTLWEEGGSGPSAEEALGDASLGFHATSNGAGLVLQGAF